MSKLDAAIEDLKALPPSNLERAADYLHRLKLITDQERLAIIDRTSGSLTREEATSWSGSLPKAANSWMSILKCN